MIVINAWWSTVKLESYFSADLHYNLQFAVLLQRPLHKETADPTDAL